VGLAAGATWLAAAFLFRISSLGALAAALLAPVYALLLGRPAVAALAAFMGVLIYIRHAANIGRLLKGQEPKIGAKKA
jgi:glycerol-3-phosphate acyltransferase PlsY